MKKSLKFITLLSTSFLLTGCVTLLNSNSQSDDTVINSSSNDSSITSEETVHVTSVSLNETSKSLTVGETFTIKATVLPENAVNKNVTFSSSNQEIASVDNVGLISALIAGEATITVKTSDGGFTASCSVTVLDKNVATKTEMKYTYDDYIDYNAYSLSNCPNIGNPKLLVIPVWFSDSESYISSSKKETVRSDIKTAYFGTNSETGWQSVKTYYEELSGGKLSLTGTVSSWYEVDETAAAFGPYDTGGVLTNNTVSAATNWFFANNPTEKRSDYDRDGDGYLDGVILIYAAPDCNNYETFLNNGYSNLWAYCYWLQNNDNDVSNPNPNVFFWASYDFMYSSSKALTQSGYSFGYGDTTNCNIDTHTYIHEMGHVLGLDDYYDCSYQYNPAGGFSMQDYNVGSHDPFSVMALGWANPYIPTDSCEITIGTFQESKDLILLSPSWNSDDSPFDEYLLLELYSPTGLNEFDTTYKYKGIYPQGLDTIGIRLWHVDARLVHYLTSDEDEELSANNITTNPTVGTGVLHMMTNTYYKEDYNEEYMSPLGKEYSNYNILQLIRSDKSETYQPTTYLTSSSLFKAGDSFSMSSYSDQFVNGTKLNSGKNLGWSFNVKSISSNQATIELIKN